MTQYDAGPGDLSDREWEAPDWESKPHAKRQRLILPPWALLAIVVAVVILLCGGLILLVRALGGAGAEETPTPSPTATLRIPPTPTFDLAVPTVVITEAIVEPTPTVVLPTESPVETPAPSEIAPGATVVVSGTGGRGLNLRAEPTTRSQRIAIVKDGTRLTVVEGPEEARGYVWWKVRAPNGREGWAAADWLELSTQ
jgi:hypothetical protein